jgi:hypothetical protein
MVESCLAVVEKAALTDPRAAAWLRSSVGRRAAEWLHAQGPERRTSESNVRLTR